MIDEDTEIIFYKLKVVGIKLSDGEEPIELIRGMILLKSGEGLNGYINSDSNYVYFADELDMEEGRLYAYNHDNVNFFRYGEK